MKSFDVLRMNKIILINALLGLVVVMIVGVSLLPHQSSNATGNSIGNELEAGDGTNMTSFENLNPVLGSTFLNGTDTLTSFNPINETFTQISYAGERSIHPPNNISHLTINATESGNLSMIHQPGGVTIVYGQSLLTTKDNNNNTMKPENATAILIDLNGVRSDDPRSSTGVALFKTNSTGHLAFLDNMIAIYQVKASPEGTDIRMWEWKGADILFE